MWIGKYASWVFVTDSSHQIYATESRFSVFLRVDFRCLRLVGRSVGSPRVVLEGRGQLELVVVSAEPVVP